MDPYQRLPPELRVMILSMIPSHDTTLHLISASPVMLAQYLSSQRQCFLSFLRNMAGCSSGPVFDEMLQDAIGLVYLQNEKLDTESRIAIAKQWKQNTLPNPFSTGDDQTIDKVRPSDPDRFTQYRRLDDMCWPFLYNYFRKFLSSCFEKKSHITRLRLTMFRPGFDKTLYKSIVPTLRTPKNRNYGNFF
ncbi:hypothetical protein SNK03_012998 [Fusarium graminearum]